MIHFAIGPRRSHDLVEVGDRTTFAVGIEDMQLFATKTGLAIRG